MYHNDNTSDISRSLISWYQKHQRDLPWRRSNDPYAIWVSEVMLQQTQVKTVISYYNAFLKNFPSIMDFAAADLQHVLKIWEGLGYYARARNLHRAAIQVSEQSGGKIPNDWHHFRALPGVGDYIAAAVLSIAYNLPFAVVDGNVKRVLARLFVMSQAVNKSSSNKTYQLKASELLDNRKPGEFNQALMELGALICTPRQPNCTLCPLNSICKAFISTRTAEFPKREKKQPTPLYHIAVGVVRKKGRILITRRQPEGLLGGLWEFPGGKIHSDETPTQACKREIFEETSLTINNLSFLTRIRHAYTHFKVKIDIFLCDFAKGSVRLNGPMDYRWITLSEIEKFPFPKANHKFIPLLKQRLEAESNEQNK
ncbi:MAG: A/G-specific adenine glycosylase [Desulfobacteraceae bacterium]|jgi:A/G-specific adenine glycosylase